VAAVVKRTFGAWITRLVRGGHTLTDAEHHLLCLLVGQLPPRLRATVERQFESYNLVQRESDGRALNFYRVRVGKSGALPVGPLLSSKLDVAPLVRISATVHDNKLICFDEKEHGVREPPNSDATDVSQYRRKPLRRVAGG
jgi:hypothetical protein